VLQQEILLGPGGLRTARHGVVVQGDFELLVVQRAIEVARVPARIEHAPGRLDGAAMHHVQQRRGQLWIVAIRVVRQVPHCGQPPRPVPQERHDKPLLPRRMQDAAQQDLAQFVRHRLEKRRRVVGRQQLSVALPVEHRAILGLQRAVVGHGRPVRGGRLVLQDRHTLLQVDDREQQVRRQQDGASLTEPMLGDRAAAYSLSPRVQVGKWRGGLDGDGMATEHVQRTVQLRGDRMLRCGHLEPCFGDGPRGLDPEHVVQPRRAAHTDQCPSLLHALARRVPLVRRQPQLAGQHDDGGRPACQLRQFLRRTLDKEQPGALQDLADVWPAAGARIDVARRGLGDDGDQRTAAELAGPRGAVTIALRRLQRRHPRAAHHRLCGPGPLSEQPAAGSRCTRQEPSAGRAFALHEWSPFASSL